MNYGNFTIRTTLLDGDRIVGHRGTAPVGEAIPESSWTWATLREAMALLFAPAAHVIDTDNPHEVTAAQVGLGSVQNLTPAAMPVSDATAAAIASAVAAKAPLSSPTFTDVPAAPTAAPGTNTTQLATTAFVTAAIAAYTGGTWGSIGGTLVNQTDLVAAFALKAPLASPALTGTPTAPTAVGGTNTTQIATTAFVSTAIATLIASAPGALDTLNELAAALGNDANFATTITNALTGKAALSHTQAASTISDSTAAGRALLTAADESAQRTALALGTAATSATTDFIAASASPASYEISAIAWTAAFEANRLAVVADGTPLSTWADFSSNARNATASGGARPAYKIAANGINGQPVVRFSAGTYMQTVTGGQSLTGNWYMAAVVKLTSLTGVSTFLAFGEEAAGKRRELVKSSPADVINGANMVSVNGYTADLYGKTTLTAGTAYFVEAVRSGTTVTIYLNGTIERFGTVAYNAFASAILTLGGNNAGAENFLGDLALGLFLDSVPSGATLTAIRSYVSRIYGITVSGAAVSNALVSFPVSGSGLSGSAMTDDGTTVTLANRRARFSSNGYNMEHIFVADEPLGSPDGAGLNVMRLQQKNPAGYSVTYGVGHDVPEGSEGYGFAQGWGNINAIAPYGNCAFFESYNSATTTFYQLRFIQTNSTGAFRRQVFDDATSDIFFYGRVAHYPSEGLLATLGTAGFSIAGALTTGAPTAGGAAAWKLGAVQAGTGLAVSTTAGLRVNVAGTDYTVALLTTNP